MSDRPDTEADDLDALLPERTVTVAGRALTVRELTLRQSLQVHWAIKPVIAELAPAYAPGGSGVGVDTLFDALSLYPDVAIALLSHATGEPVDWLVTLPESQSTPLLLAFIGLHIPFFATRLELAHQMTAAQALAKSSPVLSATGTTAPH